MKINERKGLVSQGVEGPGPIRPDAPSAAPPPGSGVDRVTVSDTGRELARLRSELGPVELLRADRVASIQDVMAKGQYSADPPRVARDFLGEILAQLLS